jgi:CHASE3 domain sensor protein
MIKGLRGTFGAWARPALRVWDRIPMRVQGRITVGLPLVAVVVSAGLAIMGGNQRADIETDIQRKFEMSAALGELTTLMVNAETGMRGYLLTDQGEFLTPFDQATAELPGTVARLTELASAEPGEGPRADKLGRLQHIRTLTDQQLADLASQRSYVTSGARDVTDPELRQHLAYGKSLMDAIRVEVDAMQDEERTLLDDRIADVNAIRTRDYASVALALVAALAMRFLAWFLFRKGILRRVEQLTENVRDLRGGRPPSFPPTGKNDAMGELEREIRLIDSSHLS